MSSRALLALPFVAAALLAQQPDALAARLLADLADDERSLAAVHGLCAMRGDAVPLLLRHLRERRGHGPEDRGALMAVYTLGMLGDLAAPAARPLLEELAHASGALELQILWALGEMGPAAAARDDGLAGAVLAARPKPGPAHQEWAIAVHRIDLGLQPSPEQVDELLHAEDLGSLVAVAAWLRRDPRPLDGAQRELLAGLFRRLLADHSILGTDPPMAVDFELGTARQAATVDNGMDRAVREVARVVALRLPLAPERVAALVLLAAHFDPDVRVEAARALGGSGDRRALPGLRLLLEDDIPAVRREAVTALGMLGPLAAEAADKLEFLAESADRQLATRAAASLRAVRKKG